MGNLPVNDIPAKVLFDIGASHCYMSTPFFTKHDFISARLEKPLAVVSPGKHLSSHLVVPDVSIKMVN